MATDHRLRPHPRSHGTGAFDRADFRQLGRHVVIEPGVLVFHAETITIGDDVYIGHYAILKGYHRGSLQIGDGTWIGQHCFLHSAGGLIIGRDVGIGPGARIITSTHMDEGDDSPIVRGQLRLAPVTIEEGADIGVGVVILPGVTVGAGAQVGAGAVVTRDVPSYTVAAGVPARVVRSRAGLT